MSGPTSNAGNTLGKRSEHAPNTLGMGKTELSLESGVILLPKTELSLESGDIDFHHSRAIAPFFLRFVSTLKR